MPSTVRQRKQLQPLGPKRKKLQLLSKATKAKKERTVLITNAPSDISGLWYLSVGAALPVFVLARLFAATWSFITDCDETYNYWEPIHYLIYGHGLQTWEYSPAYGLRSYAALWTFAAPGIFLRNMLQLDPQTVFYLLRCLLAVWTAFAEMIFYKGICFEFGVHVGRVWLFLTVFSTGSFISSAAMLPSAWCSALSSAALASWWLGNLPSAVLFTALSALLGWPFAGLLGVPIAIDFLFRQGKWKQFLHWCIISLLLIVPPVLAIDTWYYGKPIFPPLNLVKYNVFTDHGPDLYGVEDLQFYSMNGFLNFNITWLLALVCPIILILVDVVIGGEARPRASFCKPYWLTLMPLYSWLIVFGMQPHKEERFLYPVYSMICLCGSVALDGLQKLGHKLLMLHYSTVRQVEGEFGPRNKSRHYLDHTRFIMIIVVGVAILLGASRTTSLNLNYSSAMSILKKLHEENTDHITSDRINVCYGKEWYRFPSSFHLPEGRFRLGIVKSEFAGMLPSYYSTGPNATSIIHDHFNDLNREDPRAYTDIGDCHYLVDSDTGAPTKLEPAYILNRNDWTILDAKPFLYALKSSRLFRAFYIPYFTPKYTRNAFIVLLKSTKIHGMNINKDPPRG